MTPEMNVHPTADLVMNEDRDRAELWDTVDGERTFIGFIGFADHDAEAEATRLQHTIVNERFGRQGYARCLVALLLDRFVEQQRPFISECTYIDYFLERYPQYKSLQRPVDS